MESQTCSLYVPPAKLMHVVQYHLIAVFIHSNGVVNSFRDSATTTFLGSPVWIGAVQSMRIGMVC